MVVNSFRLDILPVYRLSVATDVLAAVEAGGGTAEVETVNGTPLSLEVVDGNVVINGTATVTTTDLEAGNGVVHVIDAVLTPPAE